MGKKKKQKEKAEKLEKELKAEKTAKEKKAAKAEKAAKTEKAEKTEKAAKAAKAEKTAKVEKAAKAEKKAKSEKAGETEKTAKAEKPFQAEKPAIAAKKEHKTKQPFPENDIETAAMFRALSDENRIQIIRVLSEQEMCAADLLGTLSIVQSTLSHHMKILTESGVVNFRRQGKWTWYSLNKETAERMIAYIKGWSEMNNGKE